MKRFFVLSACVLPMFIAAASASVAAPRSAAVALVWRIPAPQSSDPGVQAVEAGMTAVSALDAQLRALGEHPRARMTFALDPQFVVALQQLAAGTSALPDLSAGRLTATDARATDLLDVLSRDVVANRQLAATSAGKRFSAHAAAARLALMGDSAAHFSTHDEMDFAGIAILLALSENGYARELAPLLRKDDLNAHDVQAVADAFAHAARDVLAKIKTMSVEGSIELAALPAYEPIVPLIIDAAGRTRDVAFTVNVAGRSDAAAAIEEGMRSISALNGDAAPAVLSPHGAYDDQAAAVMQERHPAYAIFSDRVAKATTGASSEAVSASKAAALHSYLLATSRSNKLPIFFCSDTLSGELAVLPDTTPAAALGDRIRDMATEAMAAQPPTSAPVLLLCLDINAPALHRPDRTQLLAHVNAILQGDGVASTTPKDFLRRHPATAETYGFEPASDAGGFGLWMGTANQASLWTALADARKSAGGDAALSRASTRAALLRAESYRWFMALNLPQPRAAADRTLTQFRSAIAQIYRSANLPVPSEIAPVKWERPGTIGTSNPGSG